MSDVITLRTRGGAEWIPEYVTALDGSKCIGCGRCYKVCPRNVFELIDRTDIGEDDFYDEDDEMKVMSVKDAMDCIGCMSCARVCPKNCHTHEALAG